MKMKMKNQQQKPQRIMYQGKSITITKPSSSNNNISIDKTTTLSRDKKRIVDPNSAAMWNIDPTTAHGAWALQLIAIGTPTLQRQAEAAGRMCTIVGKSSMIETTADDVLRYLHGCQRTCLPQSIDQYLSLVRCWGERQHCDWSQLQIWPLIRRGLQLTSTERKHALPMTVPIFKSMLTLADVEMRIVASFAFLAGARLDEIYRLRRTMIRVIEFKHLAKQYQHFLQFRWISLHTGKESKTGKSDPDALRFIDVVLFRTMEFEDLRQMMSKSSDDNPIFTKRAAMTQALKKYGMTDHSFKTGAADLMTEFIRDGALPESCLPLMLKHKQQQDAIQSVTSGYLSENARTNLLQTKHMFDAAILMRRKIFQDV